MEEYVPNPVAEQVNIHSALQQSNQIAQQTQQQQYALEESEKNLVEAQLEVDKTLNYIYHLLKQDVIKENDKGLLDWKENPNQKERVLTDLGVERIMRCVRSYVNKETLLSNFDEDQINRRMLTFCKALNGNLFLKYEIYFRSPTLEECETILKKRFEEQNQLRKIASEISGKDDGEAVDLMAFEVEKELLKIKQEQKQVNLREYELMFTEVVAIVEATHNRAYRGEERGSLRRHFNISEVIGGGSPPPKKSGGMFGWLGKG